MSEFLFNVRLLRDIIRSRGSALSAMWTESFPQFAIAHHLCHTVLGHLSNKQNAHLLPAAGREAMRAEVARRHEKTLRLARLMPELRREFARAGLEVLFIKGFIFATLYYDDVSHRCQADVDLLVKRHDMSRALRVLTDLGFAPKRRRIRQRNGELTLRAQRLRTEHALALYRDSLCIDLHWALRTAPAYRLDESAPWRTARAAVFQGEAYPTLSHEQALVLLLVSIAHDIGRGGCKLKHILDARQLLLNVGESMDWFAFFRRRASENTLSITVNALHAVLAVFDGEEEFPRLNAALARHKHLIDAAGDDVHDPNHSGMIDLLGNGRGHPANAFWLLRVYPVNWIRDPIWWIDRNLPTPSRIFRSSIRAIRFTGRCMAHAMR